MSGGRDDPFGRSQGAAVRGPGESTRAAKAGTSQSRPSFGIDSGMKPMLAYARVSAVVGLTDLPDMPKPRRSGAGVAGADGDGRVTLVGAGSKKRVVTPPARRCLLGAAIRPACRGPPARRPAAVPLRGRRKTPTASY